MNLEENKSRTVFKELTLLLLSTLTIMEGAVISPVIQKIAENFISNPNAEFLSRLLFTIPALSFAISAFFIGYIIDKLGRKPVLIVSLVLYIIFGSSGFYLNNIYAILCSRALLGISAAGVTNTVLTLIGDYYTGKKRNRVVGFQAAFTSFGGVTYLLLGGALGGIQWNYPFLIYLIPVLFLPLALVFLPEPSKDTSEILTIENEKIRIEEETEENAGVQGKTTISIIIMCYIFIFFTMIALYHVVAQFSFYVPTKIPTISSFLIALIMSLFNLIAGIFGLMYRPIKKILNFQIIFILGYAIFGSGLMLMSFAGNYALFFISSSISGLGFGLVIPNLSFYLIENTSLKNRGRISSGYNAMFFLGRFLSPIIFEPILTLTNLANTIKIVGIIAFVLTFVSIVIFLINISIKRKRKLISYQNNQ